jgi:hypothetical protein
LHGTPRARACASGMFTQLRVQRRAQVHARQWYLPLETLKATISAA